MKEMRDVFVQGDDRIEVSTRLGMAHLEVKNPYGGYSFSVPLKLLAHFAFAVLRHYCGTWFGWKIKREYQRLAQAASTPATK